MATFTTPKTYSSSILSAAELNTYQRDNITFLGENRVAHIAYTPTLTDVDNTVTETVTLTTTIVSAIADEEHIHTIMDAIYRNNNTTTTLQIDVLYGGVEATLFSETLEALSAEVRSALEINWIRAGSDMDVSIPGWHETASGGAVRIQNRSVTLAAPSFAASQTLSIKITHGAAHANTYFRPQAARVRYIGSVST